jgi:hypothetical protein
VTAARHLLGSTYHQNFYVYQYTWYRADNHRLFEIRSRAPKIQNVHDLWKMLPILCSSAVSTYVNQFEHKLQTKPKMSNLHKRENSVCSNIKFSWCTENLPTRLSWWCVMLRDSGTRPRRKLPTW